MFDVVPAVVLAASHIFIFLKVFSQRCPACTT